MGIFKNPVKNRPVKAPTRPAGLLPIISLEQIFGKIIQEFLLGILLRFEITTRREKWI